MRFELESHDCRARVKVAGVGAFGIRAVTSLFETCREGVDFLAVDSDRSALDRASGAERVLVGSPAAGRSRIAEKDLERVRAAVDGVDLLVLVAGMGGETGTQMAVAMARMAREQNAMVLAVLSLPSALEGSGPRILAEEGVREMKRHADVTTPVDADALRAAGRDREKDTERVSAYLAAIAAEWLGFLDRQTQSLDFCDIRLTLGPEAVAVVASPAAAGPDRAVAAAASALASPVFSRWPHCPGSAVLIIHGGPDLRLAEIQRIADFFGERFAGVENIYFSADADEAMESMVRVSFFARARSAEAAGCGVRK